MTLTDAYSNGILSKEIPTELGRLQALERMLDPVAHEVLGDLRPEPGWRCLDMGAGAGSIAYWLAERCPSGRVVAADIDPRHLDPGRAAPLEVATVDLTREDFSRNSFDLVHTRALLAHLPQRDELVRKAVTWLRPGGHLVVGEFYILPLDDAHPALRTGVRTLAQLMGEQGTDVYWARRVPALLKAAGLTGIQVRLTPLTIGIGEPVDEFWRRSFEQYLPILRRRGTVPGTTLDELTKMLDDSSAADLCWFFVTASGRAPEAPARTS
ncbi:class I SAM-dependent methyltransferase [Streptomyces sp. ICBB 8177]|uniref:class I SAM-dependent methyltransferase n=1 Tax=Streptomyces sp. ICBB 8177 TaxID=563922 RepID=UPI0013051379|nr:class I SAM-dependent methyltransferase [Streptomyces sp. ICBB 8177]